MLFNSYEFLLFFPIVVAVYFIIPKRVRYLWLLVASYYFYMSWNAEFALLLASSTIVTWFSGLWLAAIHRTGRFIPIGKPLVSPDDESGGMPPHYRLKRNLVVALSFTINLGILAFFKYFDFVLNNVNVTLAVFSVEPFEKPFDLLLPVGISFYTFQALSYTVDVYRGDVKAERNPLKYALFVSFFPQLVAGPIERSSNLLVQVENVQSFKLWNLDRVTRGIILMCWGYFLKMVIADRAAILVNTVYDEYWMYGSVELSVATICFAMQIVCDFAGYSTIAIGAAKVMGFELMENFRAPYFSTSIKEFWRRWHISLSTWFRDYLYIPLGGSRKGKVRTYANVMIVFLVSGLWHGASWSFVVWGALHGTYQVIGGVTKPAKDLLWRKTGVKTEAFSWKFGKAAVTFFLVCIAWVFFRAPDIDQAAEILGAIFTEFNPWVLFDGSILKCGLDLVEFRILILAVGALLLVDLVRTRRDKTLDAFLMEQNLWFRWAVMIGLICSIFVFGVYGPEFVPQEFIYFQF